MPTLQTVDTDSRSEGIDAGRMEAFSDGVIAIIVTIMVLELRPPEDVGPAALVPLWPTFLAYALSFSLVAIYWVNHHNLLHAARRVGNDTLWLNVHFLFWLSLFPFAAAYIGDTRGAPFSVALYAGLCQAWLTQGVCARRTLPTICVQSWSVSRVSRHSR